MPKVFEKAGRVRVANTPAEETALVFDGYKEQHSDAYQKQTDTESEADKNAAEARKANAANQAPKPSAPKPA